MKNLKKIFAVLTIIFIASCSKNEDATPTPEPTPTQANVYLVGEKLKPSNPNLQYREALPVLWKNGIPSFLAHDPALYTYTTKILVVGNDTYVLGAEITGNRATSNYTSKIILWKNNVPTTIPSTSTKSDPSDMIIENGNIHILGYEKENGQNFVTFKYWKNGNATTLTSSSAQISQMILSNGDIYMCGYESNGSRSVAKYWKNGAAISISDGTKYAQAKSIAVVGSEVSVLLEDDRSTTSSIKDLKIWKNGSVTTLGTGNFSFTGSKIFIENSITHVLGMEDFNSDGDRKVVYWKNGVKTNITNTTDDSYGRDMTVSGNDAVISYYEGNLSAQPYRPNVSKYWRNGAVTNLGAGNASQLYLFNNDVYAIKHTLIYKNGVEFPIQFDDQTAGYNIYDIFIANQ
jgi:hypothetical protein